MGEPELGAREREVLRARRESLERLRAVGVEPFAFGFEPSHTTGDVRERHRGLAPGTETDDEVVLAGRVVLARRFRRLVFLTLRDRTGDLQLFCEEDTMDPGSFSLLAEVDLGDIVGAEGRVMTTRTGELSIRVRRLTMLSKALRPLPEKWHGLKDPDLQQRHRYLQLATDLEARQVVEARAKTLRAFRRVLDERGFVEVETPVLHPSAGGAIARPFVTHHRALDVDLYLRIALELYLKRLLVGGLERVFEIGRTFRNEGIGPKYNPEFTMLELYEAYGDYFSMMEIGQALIQGAAIEVRGSTRQEYQGRELDLGGEWPRTPMLELVSEATGEEVTLDRGDLGRIASRHGVDVHPTWGPGKQALELYEKLVEGQLWAPIWVMDLPREVSPLARPHRSAPGLVEHADLVIAGMEIIPAYSELSDPDEQRRSFEIQREAREQGEEETHPMDEDFLLALEQGMPPAGGLGLGVDRLLMILANASSIRDVILFPHHRPQA
ncbi:MAG TPA: lysine--tRNA ligase [Actinomycetota bacterium]|nr:lysine--tRNA ligase [Actinomycetota bacterium]